MDLCIAGAAFAAMVVAFSGTCAFAQEFSAHLSGFEEIPTILSKARGTFNLELNKHDGTATYRLTYSNLRGPVVVIHFGAIRVAGGVVMVLCGGSGKPACPITAGPTAPVTGTITSGDIQTIVPQGVMAGDFGAFQDMLGHNSTYINIHTLDFPEGEIRGQIHRSGVFNITNATNCINVMNSFNNAFNDVPSKATLDSDDWIGWPICVEK